jgi:FkbM family methyltransferase
VADGTGLENRKGCKLLVGSNPTPSAERTLEIFKNQINTIRYLGKHFCKIAFLKVNKLVFKTSIERILLADFKNKNYEKFAFVIIGGAYNRSDPSKYLIKLFKILTIFVEPIPQSYEYLKKKYRKYNFKFYNFAISDKIEFRNIYYVPNLKFSLGFRNSLLTSSMIHSLSEKRNLTHSRKVYCVDLHSFLSENKIYDIFCLQLDVEGFEIKILKGFKFSEFNLKWILVEHKLVNKKELYNLLNSNGYSLNFEDKNDALFVKNR